VRNYFTSLGEADPREGFLEPGDFPRLRQELPEHLRMLFTLAYYTGTRAGEIRKLRWENVDLIDEDLRLRDTKNGRPRTVPLNGETVEMLKIEHARRPECEWVFSVGSFRKAWKRACSKAGFDGLLFHDLRRSGVRNLVRSGVPESVAMAISGHKTRAVFERYNITSNRDLKEAMRKVTDYNLARPADAEAQTVVQ
jgi:integrase